MWRTRLRAGCYGLPEAIIEAGSEGATREELAEQAGYAMKGGTFGSYLSTLTRNDLVRKDVTAGEPVFVACDILFPEAG